MHALIVLLLFSWFVPEGVSLALGPIELNFTRTVAMIAVPAVLLCGRLRLRWPDAVAALVFLLLGVSLVGSAVPDAATRSIEALGRTMLDLGGAYLAGRFLANDPPALSRVLSMMCWVLAASAPIVLLEAVAHVNLFHAAWSLVGRMPPLNEDVRFGLHRAMGWTTHPIMLGLTYAALLPVALAAALQRASVVGRFAWLKVAALSLGVFASLSSGAWIAALVGVGAVVWDKLGPRPAWVRWLPVWVGGPSAYLFLDVLANRPFLRIMMAKLHLTSEEAVWYRWMLYERVTREMPGHWVFGHGFATPEAFAATVGWSIDNHYLVLLLTRGVVGVAVWVAFMTCVALYRAPSLWGRESLPTGPIARAMAAAVAGSAIAQLSVAMFSTAEIMLYFVAGASVSLTAMIAPANALRGAPHAARSPVGARP